MTGIHKRIFELSYGIPGRKELRFFEDSLRSQKLDYNTLVQTQNEQLEKLVHYSFANVPYYRKLFKESKLTPADIKGIDDLYKVPILTKDLIKQHYKELFPQQPFSKYFNCTTGGSTGASLKFRCSENCYSLGVALMYRGWSYAGYKIGDPVFLFGGGSIVKNSSSFRTKISYKVRNLHPYSSYGVSDEDFMSIISKIRKLKPLFYRGYASSIYHLARYIEQQGGIHTLQLNIPKAVFTTAEMLYPNQRSYIERVFQAKVFNNYGLNDGGISAYEDGTVDGFLVDSERAIMECVNEDGINDINAHGKLIATSLHNYDFPFIRYDTGDLGIVSDDLIKEGKNRLLLKELLGRSNDFLEINGKIIGSPALTVLMGKIDVHNYQIIQENNGLTLLLDKGEMFTNDQEVLIRKSLHSYLGNIEIKIVFTNNFIKSKNKHKFIIKKDGLSQ